MTTTFRPLPLTDSEIYWKEPRVGSSLTIADFLPGRECQRGSASKPTDEAEIEAAIRRAAEERRRSVRLIDPLEHLAYSLLSAAALAALLLGILCSFDFAHHLPSPPPERAVLTSSNAPTGDGL
jgi:hypothetical protein